MSDKHSPTSVDMIDRWCELTGDDTKSVRHRVREMRRAGLMPDCRVEKHLTDLHVSSFLIAMLAADQHIDAAAAVARYGRLPLMSEVNGPLFPRGAKLWAALASIMERPFALGGGWEIDSLTIVSPHPVMAAIEFINPKNQAPQPTTARYATTAKFRKYPEGGPVRVTRTINGSVVVEMSYLARKP